MFRFKICERRIIKAEILDSLEFFTVSYLLNDNSRQPLLVVKFAIEMGLERKRIPHFLKKWVFSNTQDNLSRVDANRGLDATQN